MWRGGCGWGGCGCRGGNCGGWNGWGPNWNGGWGWNNWGPGWGGGWGFGGPCNKCGHCCLCNRDNNRTALGLAAMHYACLCNRPFFDGCNRFDGGVPFFKGGFPAGGFPIGGRGREEVKERVCEDVRSIRGAYRYF